MANCHQFPKYTPPLLFNKKPFLAEIPYNSINWQEMAAPKEFLDLVERFDRNRDAYKSVQYNETQLRREFLDPFFTAFIPLVSPTPLASPGMIEWSNWSSRCCR